MELISQIHAITLCNMEKEKLEH